MTCTREQIRKLMRYARVNGQEVAAVKAGMSLRTARNYLRGKKAKKSFGRKWRTRKDPFGNVWEELKGMLVADAGLEAKTLMEWLIDREPGVWKAGQLRTLQRRVRDWRALEGPSKEVYFSQKIQPGRQSQSDYTCCNELEVKIDGKDFPHLLFHFMLPYSRWETVSIAFSESFETLTTGYSKAVRELGAVAPEHRTDNLTPAVLQLANGKAFQKRWVDFLKHYDVQPSSNNAGMSHENGSVEKSHDLLKNAIDQKLRLRGSREFGSVTAYEEFLKELLKRRNRERREKCNEELRLMKPLPRKDWNDPKEMTVRVSPGSTVVVMQSVYSVPSRLINSRLRVLVYAERVELYYGGKLVQEMPKLQAGEVSINYRHVITHLVRKPGAFRNYRFRDELFPSAIFRKAFDKLLKRSGGNGEKEYLGILNIAALNSESKVEAALTVMLEQGIMPTVNGVKEMVVTRQDTPNVIIYEPSMRLYDNLLGIDFSHEQGVSA